jgi:hypothetical protein
MTVITLFDGRLEAIGIAAAGQKQSRADRLPRALTRLC